MGNFEYVKAPNYRIRDYITPNKVYAIVKHHIHTQDNGWSFEIMLDVGVLGYCLEKNCAHLAGDDWTPCNEKGVPLNTLQAIEELQTKRFLRVTIAAIVTFIIIATVGILQ